MHRLTNLDQWAEKAIDALINEVVNELEVKFPKVALPLRVAVTGSASSPSIGTTLELVGRERSLARIESACEYLHERKLLNS
jgi:glutamyl-tRNA synthetase